MNFFLNVPVSLSPLRNFPSDLNCRIQQLKVGHHIHLFLISIAHSFLIVIICIFSLSFFYGQPSQMIINFINVALRSSFQFCFIFNFIISLILLLFFFILLCFFIFLISQVNMYFNYTLQMTFSPSYIHFNTINCPLSIALASPHKLKYVFFIYIQLKTYSVIIVGLFIIQEVIVQFPRVQGFLGSHYLSIFEFVWGSEITMIIVIYTNIQKLLLWSRICRDC